MHLGLRPWEDQLKFAGFILTDAGYQIDPALTEAIAKFPTPQNVTDLRSFMGLVNQLGPFTPNVAGLVEFLHTLLSSKNDFRGPKTTSQRLKQRA